MGAEKRERPGPGHTRFRAAASQSVQGCSVCQRTSSVEPHNESGARPRKDKTRTQSPATKCRGAAETRTKGQDATRSTATEPGHRAQPQGSGARPVSVANPPPEKKKKKNSTRFGEKWFATLSSLSCFLFARLAALLRSRFSCRVGSASRTVCCTGRRSRLLLLGADFGSNFFVRLLALGQRCSCLPFFFVGLSFSLPSSLAGLGRRRLALVYPLLLCHAAPYAFSVLVLFYCAQKTSHLFAQVQWAMGSHRDCPPRACLLQPCAWPRQLLVVAACAAPPLGATGFGCLVVSLLVGGLARLPRPPTALQSARLALFFRGCAARVPLSPRPRRSCSCSSWRCPNCTKLGLPACGREATH